MSLNIDYPELFPKTLPPLGDWIEDAACRGANPNRFFPTTGESLDAAKALCASCSVRADCLTYALDNVVPYGIWGGLSERQRRPLRAARNQAQSVA
jgi:WhiB family redox-sensing transcriptional regulator